jgi:site-specific recombinase XerD
MDRITAITEQWIKDNYATAKPQDIWKYKDRMNEFLTFVGMTDAEFLETYKRAKDKMEWSRQTGLKVVAFYNERLRNGYSTNTARAEASTVRAFCRSTAIPLTVPRNKIAKAKTAKGEHEFNQSELSKMFYNADIRGKAILSTAVSLGFSIEDFQNLDRDYIESLINKALTEKLEFIGFNYERGKEGVESRSHLTPEAISSLKDWFIYIDKVRKEKGLEKSKWVWCNGGDKPLSEQAINDILKDLVHKANIPTAGKVRFHLIRKFTMDELHGAGFDTWEVKRAVGKEIPTTDDTYLKGLSRKVSEKFPKAYESIRLSGFANKNETKLEEQKLQIQKLEIKLEHNSLENETLRRIIEYSIPKEALQNAITKIAKEYDVPLGKNPSQTNEPTSPPDTTIKDLLEKMTIQVKKKWNVTDEEYERIRQEMIGSKKL